MQPEPRPPAVDEEELARRSDFRSVKKAEVAALHAKLKKERGPSVASYVLCVLSGVVLHAANNLWFTASSHGRHALGDAAILDWLCGR